MRVRAAVAVGVALCAALPPRAAELRAQEAGHDPEAWRDDIGFLVERLTDLHPDPFFAVDRSTFLDAADRLATEGAEMSREQRLVGLSRLAALLQDGHTKHWLTRPELTGFHQLPIRLYLFDDGLYVRAIDARHQASAGSRVVTIGDVPVDEALDRVRPLVSRDNEMTIRKTAPAYLAVPEVLHALGIASSPDRATFEVELTDGRRDTVTLDAIPGDALPDMDTGEGPVGRPFDSDLEGEPGDGVSLVTARAGSDGAVPLWLRHPTRTFWFEFLPKSGTLYVQLNAIENGASESLEAFFGRVFAAADSLAVRRFVLDLRHNGGGDATLDRPILLGLIRRPEIDRRGGLFVLTSRFTFSAAVQLAVELERYTNAVFAGEPTGGRPNHYGDTRPVELPHSGAIVWVSTLYWQTSDPRDERPWIAPELAAPLTIEAYRTNRDPVLRTVLDWTPVALFTDRLREALRSGGIDSVTTFLRAYQGNPLHRWVDTEGPLNALAYDLLGRGRGEDAVTAFRLNAENHPGSANAWDSLGDGYRALGDTTRAASSYRRALEVDPAFEPSRSKLEEIQEIGGAESGASRPRAWTTSAIR